MKKKRRFVIPVCVLAGVALLCLGVWGLMEYFGSPLIPGSLERRYAREVAAHRQELLDFSQQCLETGAVSEGGSLPGFVRDVQVSGREAESLFVEFDCDGWGLVPSSSYYGFYYSPEGPRVFQGGGGGTHPGGGWVFLAGRGGQPRLHPGDRGGFLLLRSPFLTEWRAVFRPSFFAFPLALGKSLCYNGRENPRERTRGCLPRRRRPMTLEERMENGKLYNSADETLQAKQRALNELVYEYNATRPSETQRRLELLRQIFPDVGENCWIEPPLRANWGSHTHLGNNVYANFNLTLVDDTHVYIGDHVMIGPNVTISAAGHPIDPDLRRETMQFNFPVRIEQNVWIGAGAILLPGVTIGENSVIGAGSVVTRDIPANVVAMGVPCRVVREIGPRDKEFYFRDHRVQEGLL